MALFQLSYAELSEAFVRAKFAEPQAFGRPDIEEWLASQRTVTQPDVAAWTLIVKHHDFLERFPRGALAAIRKNADPAKDLPSFSRVSNPAPALWGAAEALYRMLPLERVRVYRGEQHIVFDNGTELPAVLVEYDDDPRSCHVLDFVDGWDAGDILLYTWKKGGQRSLRARLYLCDFFATWIDPVHQAAQSDFDRAVAVSEDGTKIVHATEVIVVDAVGRADCPPRHFFTRKILFAGDMIRFDCKKEREFSVQVERYVDMCREEPYRQALVVSCDKKASTFVTHKQFCPDPLPAPLPEPTPKA